MYYSGTENGAKKGHLRDEFSEFKTAPDLNEIGCRVSYTHGEYPVPLRRVCPGTRYRVLRPIQEGRAERICDVPPVKNHPTTTFRKQNSVTTTLLRRL